MKLIHSLTTAVLFAVSTHSFADFSGQVVRISDGDTITVLTNEKQQIRVRFNQIDAPESSQAFGQRSRQNISFLHQQIVYVQENSKDQYGRVLGTIFLVKNGRVPSLDFKYSVNFKQVQDGYAWAYRQYMTYQPLLVAEYQAKQQKLGLWADPNAIAPWVYRHTKK
ncbi:TPA: thermonuclease family protein [Acinetobacter baumannii]|uniref:thermonuclease family protein n=1 Tax=Acinetobacter baumannii TaxID=470 RepID=UPI00338F5B17